MACGLCHACGVRGPLACRSLSSLSTVWFLGVRVRPSAWQQAPLLTEPSLWSRIPSLTCTRPVFIAQSCQESWVLVYFIISFDFLGEFTFLCLKKLKKKTYWKPYDLHCGSFRKKNECFGGQSFKYWPLNYAWSSSIGKGFVSWAVRARLLVWGDSRSLEGCSWNASTLLPLHQVALWQPFSSTAVDEYRMPRQYRMLPGFFYKAGGFIWPLGFSERSVTHWQERGSSVCPHTPSSSCPHAYYSDPCRCWEGELIFIWKCSPPPPPEQINTWAVCLCGLLSFCTARLFCRERSMALIFSSLQQVMWGRALRWHYTDCGSGSSMAEIHSTLTRDTFHPWRAARSALPAVEHHSSGT